MDVAVLFAGAVFAILVAGVGLLLAYYRLIVSKAYARGYDFGRADRHTDNWIKPIGHTDEYLRGVEHGWDCHDWPSKPEYQPVIVHLKQKFPDDPKLVSIDEATEFQRMLKHALETGYRYDDPKVSKVKNVNNTVGAPLSHMWCATTASTPYPREPRRHS